MAIHRIQVNCMWWRSTRTLALWLGLSVSVLFYWRNTSQQNVVTSRRSNIITVWVFTSPQAGGVISLRYALYITSLRAYTADILARYSPHSVRN